MRPSDDRGAADGEGSVAGETEPLDDGDATVLAAVRRAAEVIDPVPAGLVERLQFAITLDALEAEVATLIAGQLTVGTRAETTEAVRTVSFSSPSLTTLLTLSPQVDGLVRMDGWTVPTLDDPAPATGTAAGAAAGAGGPARVTVELRSAAGTRRVSADVDGRFVFEAVPTGSVSLVLAVAGRTRTRTVVSPTIDL